VRVLALAAALAVAARGSGYLPARVAAFAHLLSWAILVGTNLWTTFFAGITMFKNLPRQVFGKLQVRSSLTHAFFLVTHCGLEANTACPLAGRFDGDRLPVATLLRCHSALALMQSGCDAEQAVPEVLPAANCWLCNCSGDPVLQRHWSAEAAALFSRWVLFIACDGGTLLKGHDSQAKGTSFPSKEQRQQTRQRTGCCAR
jgi:Domain of unknown function (DUF4149)